MLKRRDIKILLGIGCLLAIFLLVAGDIYKEKEYCMGMPILSQEDFLKYEEELTVDISKLTFCEETVAVDIESDTIFISQSSGNLIHKSELLGSFGIDNSNYSLFILEDAALNNIAESVRDGMPLTLVITDGMQAKRVSVIITTLPVLKIDGDWAYINEDNRDVMSGRMTMWCGYNPALETASVQSSALEWHVRGNTASRQEKTPWKLSLKNSKGDNNNMDLLGLGEDDDWILNSLVMDDTRIKEKLFMSLWNEIAEESEHNYKMSTGEYVEVVINGDYKGLFLLQRRLDKKYLQLADNDVLLKTTSYSAKSVEEAYEIVGAYEDKATIYSIMQGTYDRSDCRNYNVNNLIDVNIVLQLANARDNFGLKNMYYVLKKKTGSYEHFLVPWDTDQSFGITWKADAETEDGFCYDYSATMDEFDTRSETDAIISINPNYNELAGNRWAYLKQSVLSEEHIFAVVESIMEPLNRSGALEREKQLWGQKYHGEDTIENLRSFISERIDVLDAYYQGE